MIREPLCVPDFVGSKVDVHGESSGAEVAKQPAVHPAVADGGAVFERGPIAESPDVRVFAGHVKRTAQVAAEE